MSKYYVNKFLYTVDRDPDYLDAYARDAKEFVGRWEDEIGPRLLSNAVEKSTVVAFTDDERDALINHDYVALFEMGAHFFSQPDPAHRHLRRNLDAGERSPVLPARIRGTAGALARKAVSIRRHLRFQDGLIHRPDVTYPRVEQRPRHPLDVGRVSVGVFR